MLRRVIVVSTRFDAPIQTCFLRSPWKLDHETQSTRSLPVAMLRRVATIATKQTSSWRQPMSLDRTRRLRHGRCFREHKLDLRTCRIGPPGARGSFVKHRNIETAIENSFTAALRFMRSASEGERTRRIISSSVVPFHGLNLNLHNIIFCTLARTNVIRVDDLWLALSDFDNYNNGDFWGSGCRSR